jgi:hypothetical protein
LALFSCGGSAASFGGVTWQDHKAVGSFANRWSGSGKRVLGGEEATCTVPWGALAPIAQNILGI